MRAFCEIIVPSLTLHHLRIRVEAGLSLSRLSLYKLHVHAVTVKHEHEMFTCSMLHASLWLHMNM